MPGLGAKAMMYPKELNLEGPTQISVPSKSTLESEVLGHKWVAW